MENSTHNSATAKKKKKKKKEAPMMCQRVQGEPPALSLLNKRKANLTQHCITYTVVEHRNGNREMRAQRKQKWKKKHKRIPSRNGTMRKRKDGNVTTFGRAKIGPEHEASLSSHSDECIPRKWL